MSRSPASISIVAMVVLLVRVTWPGTVYAQATRSGSGGSPDTPAAAPASSSLPPSGSSGAPVGGGPPSTAGTGADGGAPASDEEPEGTAAAPDEPAQEAPVEAPPSEDWAERDRDINESNTVTGGVGLLRTQHAESGAPGQFRIGFVGEWFSAGFLCTTKFPCANPNGTGPALTSDDMDHVGGTLSLGASIVKLGAGVLEAYASTSAYANSDSANRPGLLQVLGDSNLAVKYAAPIGDVLRLGLFSELWLINTTGSVGLDSSGTSAKFGGIATGDLRGLKAHVPLRFSFNLVYSLDNTAEVIAQTEIDRGQPITRIERYGLGVNRVDHFDFFLGAEGLLVDERVRPFIEAHVLVPTNRQGYACKVVNRVPSNPSNDDCLALDSVVPSTLTLGSRFFPWKRGFSLLAALDIGLTGTANFIEEIQPVPPWTLYFGAGWAVDTWDRPPVVKNVGVEGAKPVVHLVGFVHEKDKNDPVVGATVSYHDHADLWPLATGPDGKFGGDVPPGDYTVDLKADGYKPGQCAVGAQAAKPGAEFDVDCPLDAMPRVGSVVGHVRDAESNQPLAGVQVALTDVQHKELRLSTDVSGAFRLDGAAPGLAQLSVISDGYLAMVSPVDVKARQETTVDLLLRPQPKQPKVQLTAKEITIRDQIQFALDSAVILPQSFGLLTEVADTLIRHPEIRRVEVQGHTDNSGTAEHNHALSDERAEAVRAWLVQHGVVADRLTAHGYGQDNPLVPNVTASNRARNRRVQFIIVERAGAESPRPPASGATAPGAPAGPGAPGVPGAAGSSTPPPRKLNPLPGF
ncbi:MAG: OmpA family protein [Polyangiaceae bacterium]|jgi:outer membrane protein OmpA-like peptidoglycan-associated protein